MNTIVYLLQVSACMGFFFALYYFVLSRLTFFTLNRWYLLTTLVFSFIIPLLSITVRHEYVPVMHGVIYVNQLQNLTPQLQEVNLHKQLVQPGFNWIVVLEVAYLLIAGALFVRLIVIVVAFLNKIKLKPRKDLGRVHIIHGNKELVNGSFLNYIFLNDDKMDAGDLQQIIQHEMLHVRLLHSVDRIALEMLKIILWFNPFIYLYARAVEENHEFEVDQEIGRSADKNRYAELLLQLAVTRQGVLYHSFSKMSLEKRITMLFNKPTKKMKRIIYVLVLPIVVMSCFAFANLKTEQKGVRPAKGTSYSVRATDTSKEIVKAPDHLKNKDTTYPVRHADTSKEILKGSDGRNYVFKSTSFDMTTEVKYSSFYSRTHILTQDGKSFDKVTFKLANGSASFNTSTGMPAGAFIDKVLYNEEEIRQLPAERTAMLVLDKDKDSWQPEKIPDSLSVAFCFKTFSPKK